MHWLNLCLPVLVLSPRARGRPCKRQAETNVNGRTCVCRFGHPADPSKKQADTKVNKLVNTQTPRTSTHRACARTRPHEYHQWQWWYLCVRVHARPRRSGLNIDKQINLGVWLFLTGGREVTEPSDTSIPNLLVNFSTRTPREDTERADTSLASPAKL